MATFTIATSGTEPITIQWQQDTAGDGIFADMVGENGTTLTVDDSSVNHYRANVSNACGAATSNVVQVVTDPAPSPTPEVLYTAAAPWNGFGEDCMISDGVTAGGEFIINPDGQNFLYHTTDSGATFNSFRVRTDIPTVNIKMVLQTNGNWYLGLYRDEVREPLPYFGTPDTSWLSFGHGNSSAYTHGSDLVGVDAASTLYYVDSNNNSGGSLYKLEDWYTDRNPTTTVGANANSGASSWWHTYKVGAFVYAVRGDQGQFITPDYAVWNDNVGLTLVGYYPNALFSGRTANSSGTEVKSAGGVAEGAITGSQVTVQTWTALGTPTTETYDFGSNVDNAHMHYCNGQWFTSAIDATDSSVMYIGLGSSTGAVYNIDLPHADSDYPYRTMRHIGGTEYALAYLGEVSAVSNVYVLIKVDLGV